MSFWFYFFLIIFLTILGDTGMLVMKKKFPLCNNFLHVITCKRVCANTENQIWQAFSCGKCNYYVIIVMQAFVASWAQCQIVTYWISPITFITQRYSICCTGSIQSILYLQWYSIFECEWCCLYFPFCSKWLSRQASCNFLHLLDIELWDICFVLFMSREVRDGKCYVVVDNDIEL